MKAFIQKQFFLLAFSLLLILTVVRGVMVYMTQGNTIISNVLTIFTIASVVLLVYVFQHIKKDNQKRQDLLKELEENNRKYLFNSGMSHTIEKPEEVVLDSIKSLQKANSFVKKIADGDYSASWEGMTEILLQQNQESLAGELLRMREQMRKMKEEDEKRYWTNEGLAQISTLVRNHQQHLEALSDESVRFLSKYLKMQQGSLFLLNEDEKQLELSSCYAFDKKKFVEKRINVGAGLVGQAYLEGETTVLKEVPQGYTYITSGLGDATPNFIVVIPAKYNEKVEAIMEFAGFQCLEDYQIKFIEKAGEFIASAILSARTTEKMKYLLEKAQQQAEILQSQEEEMRQNMEEMEATQEEMNRRGKEMEEMQNRLQTTTALLESLLSSTDDTIYFKDHESKFIRVSASFLRLANFNSLDEVIGKSDFDFVAYEEAKPKFDAEMDVIRTGVPMNVLEKDTLKDGSIAWISTKKFPLKNADGETVGTFGMSRDVTALQNAMLEMERQKAHMEEELREKDRLKKELDECRLGKQSQPPALEE